MNLARRRKKRFVKGGSQYHAERQDVNRLVDQITATGKISRQQYLHLMTAILTNETQSRVEKGQINQILDAAQSGRLPLVD